MEKNNFDSNTMSPAISTAETVQMDSSTKSSDLLVMETDTACNEKKVEVSNIKNKGPDLSIDHTFSKSKNDEAAAKNIYESSNKPDCNELTNENNVCKTNNQEHFQITLCSPQSNEHLLLCASIKRGSSGSICEKSQNKNSYFNSSPPPTVSPSNKEVEDSGVSSNSADSPQNSALQKSPSSYLQHKTICASTIDSVYLPQTHLTNSEKCTSDNEKDLKTILAFENKSSEVIHNPLPSKNRKDFVNNSNFLHSSNFTLRSCDFEDIPNANNNSNLAGVHGFFAEFDTFEEEHIALSNELDKNSNDDLLKLKGSDDNLIYSESKMLMNDMLNEICSKEDNCKNLITKTAEKSTLMNSVHNFSDGKSILEDNVFQNTYGYLRKSLNKNSSKEQRKENISKESTSVNKESEIVLSLNNQLIDVEKKIQSSLIMRSNLILKQIDQSKHSTQKFKREESTNVEVHQLKKARKFVDPYMTDPESEDDEEDNPTSSKNDRIRLSIKKTKCTLSSENEYKSIPLSADKGANLESIHDIVSKYMKVYADLIKYRRADKILKNHCQRLKSEENKLKLAKIPVLDFGEKPSEDEKYSTCARSRPAKHRNKNRSIHLIKPISNCAVSHYPHVHHDYDKRLWFHTHSCKQKFQLDSYFDAMPEKTTPYLNAQATPVFNDHSYVDLYNWVEKFSGPVSRNSFKMSDISLDEYVNSYIITHPQWAYDTGVMKKKTIEKQSDKQHYLSDKERLDNFRKTLKRNYSQNDTLTNSPAEKRNKKCSYESMDSRKSSRLSFESESSEVGRDSPSYMSGPPLKKSLGGKKSSKGKKVANPEWKTYPNANQMLQEMLTKNSHYYNSQDLTKEIESQQTKVLSKSYTLFEHGERDFFWNNPLDKNHQNKPKKEYRSIFNASKSALDFEPDLFEVPAEFIDEGGFHEPREFPLANPEELNIVHPSARRTNYKLLHLPHNLRCLERINTNTAPKKVQVDVKELAERVGLIDSRWRSNKREVPKLLKRKKPKHKPTFSDMLSEKKKTERKQEDFFESDVTLSGDEHQNESCAFMESKKQRVSHNINNSNNRPLTPSLKKASKPRQKKYRRV